MQNIFESNPETLLKYMFFLLIYNIAEKERRQ